MKLFLHALIVLKHLEQLYATRKHFPTLPSLKDGHMYKIKMSETISMVSTKYTGK